MKISHAMLTGILATSAAAAADTLLRDSDWQLAGRLGFMQFIVISESRATNHF